MSNVKQTPDFVSRLVGFTKVANKLMERQDTQEKAIKAASRDAVKALIASGHAKQAEAKQLVAGFAKNPAAAVELVTKLAEEVCTSKKEKAKLAKNKSTTEPVSMGGPAEEPVKKASSEKESDSVWEKGFFGA